MNNDNFNIIIQPETAKSDASLPKEVDSIKDSINKISESLVDERYIKNHPSARIIEHAKQLDK